MSSKRLEDVLKMSRRRFCKMSSKLLEEILAQICINFNLFAELLIPIGMRIKEAKAKMGTHHAVVEITISKRSI